MKSPKLWGPSDLLSEAFLWTLGILGIIVLVFWACVGAAWVWDHSMEVLQNHTEEVRK